MYEEINANELKKLKSGSSLSSLPALPLSLNSFYNSLDAFNKGVFIKIYRYLWGVVNWKTINRCEYVSSFWLLYGQMVRADLSPYAFSLLSYIYYMTNRGTETIRSSKIYNSDAIYSYKSSSIQCILTRLTKAGYVNRYTRDLTGSHLSCNRSRHTEFVKLSSAGLKLIEDMTKNINRILLNSSLNDLTSIKKPG
jgi:DNA-binding MarR family transcriptional regulator